MKRLAAGLLTAGVLALAGCGEDEGSGARDAAVEWAERVAAEDPAACRVTTERGGSCSPR